MITDEQIQRILYDMIEKIFTTLLWYRVICLKTHNIIVWAILWDDSTNKRQFQKVS